MLQIEALVTDSSTPRPDRHDSTDINRQPVSYTYTCYSVRTKSLRSSSNSSLSQLPHRDIPTFAGDPLTYRSFIRAFKHAIDSKTDSHQDRLYYIEQFTSGEQLDLVRSCEHMRLDRPFKEARALLDCHYGDELTVATAYIKKAMEWPQIKSALFLIGCSNTVNDVDNMYEMNNPSNMKCILSKLPYKLKERWRSCAYNIQEKSGRRARFPDLS